ncbi:MAG: Flp pilus assembly complex ATPase component TadA [Myxococcales bacterium]|nr:Flp pilus assembly complex ATPase component TadA [Myxococcales bacterium]MCB9715243.1 Flp pilus assembly complex ATPase component TadA [Myxococcales bacterium]
MEEVVTVVAAAPPPPPSPQPRLPPQGLRPDTRPLGEIMIERGFVTPEALAEALSVQHLEDERLGETLVRLKHCSDWQVCQALAQQFGLPALESLPPTQVDDELAERLPISYARGNMLLPRRFVTEGGTLEVLASDPTKLLDLDDLAQVYDAEVELTLMPSSAVGELINTIYSKRAKDVDLEKKEEVFDEEDEDILHASAEDAPIIRFVNSLIFNASKEKASDIHIEPGDREIVVRNRVDGVLHETKRAPKAHMASIVARVKIMAGLNIAEKRLPQDGRIRRKIAGKEVDMRVATVPTAHGERITIRLLDKSAMALSLDAIGMAPDHLRIVKEVIHRPHGIFLVTGPTGSGKTTTLYSCLATINQPNLNILTVEDPVEYQLAGISQVQVQPKIDLTFASGLRSFLRHDPDVIMVGEIRDLETAEIAIQASLTGHLVLSTIHTNDAATGITRLVDMGVQPFLVASSLVALQAQRLLRRVCPSCCRPHRPLAAELEDLGVVPDAFFAGEQCLRQPLLDGEGKVVSVSPVGGRKLPPPGMVWEANPSGCDRCGGTGYQGRTGVYELLTITEEVRRLAIRNADAGQIKQAAVEHGMRTLRDDGALKVLQGVTSIEEVMRVTAEEA